MAEVGHGQAACTGRRNWVTGRRVLMASTNEESAERHRRHNAWSRCHQEIHITRTGLTGPVPLLGSTRSAGLVVVDRLTTNPVFLGECRDGLASSQPST